MKTVQRALDRAGKSVAEGKKAVGETKREVRESVMDWNSKRDLNKIGESIFGTKNYKILKDRCGQQLPQFLVGVLTLLFFVVNIVLLSCFYNALYFLGSSLFSRVYGVSEVS